MILINRDLYKDPEKLISFLKLSKREKLERKALDLVINEELKEGRRIVIPNMREHYDIKSIGNKGDIRYIEIKAHIGNSHYVKLSPSQFRFSKEKGNEYWVYVVYIKEKKIIKIQNPTKNAKSIKRKRDFFINIRKFHLSDKNDINRL